MSAAKAIYTRLTAALSGGQGAFSSAFSSEFEGPTIVAKVYANDVPNKTPFPRVVYNVGDTDRPNTYGGSSGVQKCSIDIECQAESYAEADVLAKAVLDALDNKHGTWGGVNVQGCWYRGSVERHDEPLPGVAHDTYTQDMTFDLWIKE